MVVRSSIHRVRARYPWLHRSVYAVAAGTALYAVDQRYNHANFTRAIRTLYTGAAILLDYKLRFNAYNDVSALHRRVAYRVLRLCQANGGLYVKFGQSVASMNQVLPKEYNEILNVLQDQAPTITDAELDAVFRKSFSHKLPEDVFRTFERTPMASASIAQVHKATLPDGTLVAVKVQKPAIQHQFAFDLFLHKTVLWVFEKAFDLPLLWTHETIHDHLAMETDFLHEARNASLCRELLQTPGEEDASPVHVPKVYHDYTDRMVMTAEWIDGVKITDTHKWQRGWNKTYVMTKVVDAFAKQIFQGGFVHCDPHPGNILIRPHPTQRGKPQIVLLDHGLYLTERNSFRRQYCAIWEAIFLVDVPALTAIAASWGITDLNFFAASQLQRPWSAEKPNHLQDEFRSTASPEAREMTQRVMALEMQKKLKERARNFLQHSHQIPSELILIGRNMNLVRSLNKELGSPVNRVGMMARWAVRGLQLPDNLVRGRRVGRVVRAKRGWWDILPEEQVVVALDEDGETHPLSKTPTRLTSSSLVSSLLDWRSIRFTWKLFVLYLAFQWTQWNAWWGRAGYEGGLEGILEKGEQSTRARLFGETPA